MILELISDRQNGYITTVTFKVYPGKADLKHQHIFTPGHSTLPDKDRLTPAGTTSASAGPCQRTPTPPTSSSRR